MPAAYQVMAGFFTAGAAGTGIATPNAGDSFAVASFNTGAPAYLENLWANGASTDWVSIRSPRMHDNQQGIRVRVVGPVPDPLLPWGTNQPLYPADTPTVLIDQTAAATGAIAVMYSYGDLPGANPRLASWSDVQPRIKQISGTEVALTASAAIGQWSPGNAINSTFDNFNAGSDYALLGYLVPTSVLALTVAGQDTSSLKLGGPGVNDQKVTYDWFVKISNATGRPMIPIIAANNKANTLVYQTSNAVAAAQNVTLILAELG